MKHKPLPFIGQVNYNYIAFIPKGATKKEIKEVVDLLTNHIIQDTQLVDIRKHQQGDEEY